MTGDSRRPRDYLHELDECATMADVDAVLEQLTQAGASAPFVAFLRTQQEQRRGANVIPFPIGRRL